MRLIIERDAESVAVRAADWLASRTLAAIEARGRAVLALSGGRTPWQALQLFAARALPWQRVWVTQVDERIVPRDDPRRNLREIERILLAPGRLRHTQLLALPVDDLLLSSVDEARAAAVLQVHERKLRELGFDTPDVVQLGLGVDGHTASLLPDDPLLQTQDAWVGQSRPHEGVRRLTLTLPLLTRSRALLWIVTGADKSQRLAELWEGSGTAPATRLPRASATIVCDVAAAQALPEDGD